jgi:hypothetical protein
MGRYDILLEQETPSNKPAKPTTNKPVQKGAEGASVSQAVSDLDQAGSTSEFRENSLFFKRQLRESPSTDSTNQGPKRPMRHRHAFDIFQDQYEALLELGLKDRINGGAGSMSAMVREAIDAYLAAHKKK